MLKHMLMDPAFPDLVADWATINGRTPEARNWANGNRKNADADHADRLTVLGRLEIAATRLW